MAIQTDGATDSDEVAMNWHRRSRPSFRLGEPIRLTAHEAQVLKRALINAGVYARDVIRELPGGVGLYRFDPWHNAKEKMTYGRAGDRAPELIPERRLRVLRELIVEAEAKRYPVVTVDSWRGRK